MHDPLSWMTVKYKLAASYVAICLLAFGVGGYLISTAAHESLQREIMERLKWQAGAHLSALESDLQLLGRRTQDFASDGYIRESTERIMAMSGKDARRINSLTKHLLENKLSLESAFENIIIIDRAGELVAAARAGSVPHGAAMPERDDLWFGPLNPIMTGDEQPRFGITTPLWNMDRTSRLGTLVVVIDASRWITAALMRVRESGGLGEGVRMILTDPDGNRLEVVPTVNHGGVRSISVLPRPAAWVAERSGLFQREDGIALNGWSLRVDLEARKEFEPISALQGRFLFAGIMVVAASMVLVFFPMRFLVVPLTELRDSARRIADGDLSARRPVDSADEIGDLSRAFNVMAEAIEERTTRLTRAAADLERRRMELAAERDRLKTVVHCMDDGLILMDAQGEIEMANAAASPLVRLLQSAPASWSRMLPHRCPTKSARQCVSCIKNLDSPAGTCLVDLDSSVFEILSTDLGSSAEKKGRLLVARDVTEFVTLDEKQAHRERLAVMGEIAAVMAHELNNPLAAISMYAQMMERDVSKDSVWKEHIEVIRRNTDICTQTIRGLLDYAAGATPEPEQFDVHDLLDDLVRFLRPVLEKAGVKVERSYGAGEAEMMGVEMHVRQIFVNLIINAAQAAGTLDGGGMVKLGTADDGERLLITVEDNGAGVPADLKERIFEPFFTSKPSGAGTGLGLSTARRIAESIGGELVLEETGAGVTRFKASLPRVSPTHGWYDTQGTLRSGGSA